MNYLPPKNQLNILLIVIIMLPLSVFAVEKIQIQSATIFNTSCARCHEGECSGRMSFHLPKEAADQHIRRHGGELLQITVHELFELLRYMKEECSFYPFDLELVNDKKWYYDTLEKLKSPERQAYFMHLGLLEPGSYQLVFAEENHHYDFCVEVITEEFDFIDCEHEDETHRQKKVVFQVDERLEYFLRIRSQKPIKLKQVELVSP